MANVLDVVLETTNTLSLPKLPMRDSKLIPSRQKSKLQQFRLKPKLGLRCPPKWSLLTLRKNQHSGFQLKKSKLLLPKLRKKALSTSFVMLQEKNYLKKKC
jgi:hypothetical protein